MIAEAWGDSDPPYWSRIWSKRHQMVRAKRINTPLASLRVMQLNLRWTMDDKIDQHDVAKYLGVSTRTVRTLIKRGELPPPIRIGRKQFWLKDKFMCWLNDGGIASVRPRSARNPAKIVIRLGRSKVADVILRKGLVKLACCNRTGPCRCTHSRTTLRARRRRTVGRTVLSRAAILATVDVVGGVEMPRCVFRTS
jgi:predicted DNA-binding transcriptional regulator AlpA